jgi:2-C-methyl-D-erythritol 4-phosphate cytidylyltransferase/2-C-methyl-D-erythritol 2,4-cyclodiphosphate synthase
MSFAAVIVAAGTGSRAGGETPKQWRTVGGRPLVRWSVEALLAAGCDDVVVVISGGDDGRLAAALTGLGGWRSAPGGKTRSQSVRSGLAALGAREGVVMIHDAARPFVGREHVDALLKALKGAPGAIMALPVADTLKRPADAGLQTVPREGLWRAQTPQAFRLADIRAAYAALPSGVEPTDDAQVLSAAGGAVSLVPGDPRLMKLTYPEDFAMAEALASAARLVRTGMGYDAHRFGPGDQVWLCGVAIPHERSLIGHSDADAGLHALTDAILGAIGEGDIGDHFPPSDPHWRGVASEVFLRRAAELVAARGGRIINVDVTLICERPRIGPHRQAMRDRVADILAIPVDRVSVKATTTEKMGFTGREEGLAAQAVASVETPA